MILLNEWMPNPPGADASGEWIELFNDGPAPARLDGWHLGAGGKKTYALHGALGAGEYLVLPRSATKLSLANADGALVLYDAAGRVEDRTSFRGSAPEGKSANRSAANGVAATGDTGPAGTGTAFFADPTPGRVNAAGPHIALAHSEQYPFGVPLNTAPPAAAWAIETLLVTALALAAAGVFIMKSYDDVSHFFFGGDARGRREDREDAWLA